MKTQTANQLRGDASAYMANRGVTEFKEAHWIGDVIITDEVPEQSETLIGLEGQKPVMRKWTPPNGAKCWTVWIPGMTPDPLCRIWTIRSHNSTTLDAQWGWSAQEFPDFPSDFQFTDNELDARQSAIRAALVKADANE